eukprot:TRINITY_DN8257_c0_g9_i1.p1 TRINITY_DN8257_c0_g9~~TRINITY_DN8257_c0_g9_i1.p1  ORF type:complete len:672 (-),score=266.95 TRINITY_DN8257_c0_g9_i1:55-1785(-)
MPETFDQVKMEVEKLVLQELPRCGTQGPAVQQEAQQMIQQAQMRCEQIKQQRAEEERQNQQRAEEAKKVFAELVGLIEKAEQDTAKLKEVAEPVLDGGAVGEEEARFAAGVVSEVAVTAKASCKACTDFVVEKRAGIDAVKPPALTEIRTEQLKLQARVHECYKVVVTATIAAKSAIEKAAKKLEAEKKIEKRTSIFDKYSKNGVMSKDNIVSYAKGEFNFTLAKDVSAKIATKLGDKSGVPKERFQQIKVAVGIAREEEASRLRRKEAEERRKALEAKKEALGADIQKVLDALTDAEPSFVKAEEACSAKPLSKEYLASTEPAPESADVESAVEAAAKALEDTKSEITSARSRITELSTDMDEDVKQWLTFEVKKVDLKVSAFESRMAAAGSSVERGREYLQRREAAELQSLKSEVAKLLRSKKLGPEELFKLADKDEDQKVSLSEFTSLLEGCEGYDLNSEKIDKVFSCFDAGEGSLTKEGLLKASKSFYSVVSDAVMTNQEALSDESTTIRRLEPNEVLEVLEGPVQEQNTKIPRVRCKAANDGSEGWVTVTGNNGTAYLVLTDAPKEAPSQA